MFNTWEIMHGSTFTIGTFQILCMIGSHSAMVWWENFFPDEKLQSSRKSKASLLVFCLMLYCFSYTYKTRQLQISKSNKNRNKQIKLWSLGSRFSKLNIFCVCFLCTKFLTSFYCNACFLTKESICNETLVTFSEQFWGSESSLHCLVSLKTLCNLSFSLVFPFIYLHKQ